MLASEQDIWTEEGRLKEHIEDAQMLLAYAAEKGMQVEDSVASDIINSRYCLKENNLDNKQEIKFWAAFNELSQKIQPVNIDSIKATRGHGKTLFRFKLLEYFFPSNKSEAARTVLVYQRWTLFALFVLLFVQIYWFIGSIIITQVTQDLEFDDEIAALTKLIDNAEKKDFEEVGALAGQIRRNYENKIINNDSAKEIYYDRLKSWGVTPYLPAGCSMILQKKMKTTASKDILKQGSPHSLFYNRSCNIFFRFCMDGSERWLMFYGVSTGRLLK